MPSETMLIKLPNTLQDAIKSVADQLTVRMDELLMIPPADNNTVISLKPNTKPKTDEAHVRGEATILEAMRYSTLSGGKRLRPFLAVCSAGLFGVRAASAIEVASAIEFIHTYSLIHDD